MPAWPAAAPHPDQRRNSCVFPPPARDGIAAHHRALLLRSSFGTKRGNEAAGQSTCGVPLSHVQDLINGNGELSPGVGLSRELFPAAARPLIVFGSTVILRRPPACFKPSAALESVKSRIERPLLD